MLVAGIGVGVRLRVILLRQLLFLPVAVEHVALAAHVHAVDRAVAAPGAEALDGLPLYPGASCSRVLTLTRPDGAQRVLLLYATPDDVEALEMVQKGLANWQDDRWSEMSRGMGREGEQLNSDEHHLRIFWRHWDKMMRAE